MSCWSLPESDLMAVVSQILVFYCWVHGVCCVKCSTEDFPKEGSDASPAIRLAPAPVQVVQNAGIWWCYLALTRGAPCVSCKTLQWLFDGSGVYPLTSLCGLSLVNQCPVTLLGWR